VLLKKPAVFIFASESYAWNFSEAEELKYFIRINLLETRVGLACLPHLLFEYNQALQLIS
jgi:hypothetical protein